MRNRNTWRIRRKRKGITNLEHENRLIRAEAEKLQAMDACRREIDRLVEQGNDGAADEAWERWLQTEIPLSTGEVWNIADAEYP